MTPEEKYRRRDAALRSMRNNASHQEVLRRLAEYDTRGEIMGLTNGGDAAGQPVMQTQTDPPLTIAPDAPQAQAVATGASEQAIRDAAAIDRAYGDR